MSMKRRTRAKEKQKKPAVSSDPGATAAAAALTVVLAGVPLFVDSGADASFDAPKRLVALVGLALAAAAAFAWPARTAFPAWRQRPALSRAAALLLFGALGWALVAALASPRRLVALDAGRGLLLAALALPLGASRVVARRGGLLLAAFLCACAVNAAVSLAQSGGRFQPFELSTVGRRDATGAFVGNVGYLATALALSAVAALGIALFAASPVRRGMAAAALILFVAALAVNRNLTAITAALAGFAVLLVARFGRRAAFPIIAAIAALALVVAAYGPLRRRVALAAAAARAGDWDQLTTYRGGPWAASLEMARERPLLGFGPGTFGAEFVPHRLAAEIRYGRRFVNPLITSSYGEAHCDYLQPFAEIGAPGALAVLGAAALLLRGAVRQTCGAPPPDRTEAVFLLALLVTGAVAALTWFPLQRPISAVPLLLVAGRAWSNSSLGLGSPTNSKPLAWLRTAAIAAILGLLVWPEFPRYLAERKLRTAQLAFRFVLTHASEVAEPPAALARVAQLALEAAKGLPGDARPILLAGGARLAAGEGERAIELFGRALGLGERAEIDLSLGRACDALARREEAGAWFLRGGWVSPPLLATLLPDVAGPVRAEVSRLEAELNAGRLAAPPRLP
jgi:O-antigen ligase